MAKNIKNDKSNSYIFNFSKTGNEDSYYMVQILFSTKEYMLDWDVTVKGYYLVMINVKYNKETKTPHSPNFLYSDVSLLVPCERRSEGNFNKALEMMQEVAEKRIGIMEKDKETFRQLGVKDEEVDNMVEKIRKAMQEENIEKKESDNVKKEVLRVEPVEDKKDERKKKLTFDDVYGMREVKNKLYDIIDQLNNKEKYEEWGIKPINGMILYGVGGVGKSLLSEALAGEIDAEFIKISTSDIMDKYVGSSQQRVKKVFEKARKFDKCILMIDESDGLFAKRNGENNKEHNNVVNEFLYQLSNSENENIFVIATTNRIDIIDESIKRSGRFDYKIEITLPDFETRKGILELNAKKKPLSDDVDFDKIAKNMAGMNGADCALLINEAARKVLREKRNKITQADFDFILEEMVCGLASESKKLDEKTKMIVACHETHHLLANELLNVNKVKKISVLPHGSALGYLLHTNEDNDDIFLNDKEQLENKIKVMLAGRVGEELFFGKVTTGASDDLQKANNLIKTMITKFGYSDELGLLVVNDNNISLQDKVNEIMKNELDRLYQETKTLLSQHEELAKVIIDELYLKEELTGDEVERIINGYVINN